MALDFWLRTSGTWINAGTVALGTAIGLTIKDRFPLPMQRIITQGVGLIILSVGWQMAGSLFQVKVNRVSGVILGLFAIAIGGICGEWWQLEAKLNAIGDCLKDRFRGSGKFTEGFVTASLLFCVGPLTIIGSLNNGLTGDNALLTLKATMDGLAAIALTSSFGIGVAFSILVIIFYQGGISLLAGFLSSALPNPDTNPGMLLMTGVGGLMILGLGFNLLEIAKIRVASFLPALAIAPILAWLASLLSLPTH